MSRRPPIARHLVGGLFTLALLALVAWLGQIPFGGGDDAAALRLALRTVQGQIEICTERTAEELAALPQHMRTPSVCVDHTPRYRLRVTLDGREVIDQEVAPGGWRGDRPLIVDRRLELPPGQALLDVSFTPIADPSLAALQQEALDRLPAYRLARDVVFRGGRIVLVTLDDAGGRLILIEG